MRSSASARAASPATSGATERPPAASRAMSRDHADEAFEQRHRSPRRRDWRAAGTRRFRELAAGVRLQQLPRQPRRRAGRTSAAACPRRACRPAASAPAGDRPRRLQRRRCIRCRDRAAARCARPPSHAPRVIGASGAGGANRRRDTSEAIARMDLERRLVAVVVRPRAVDARRVLGNARRRGRAAEPSVGSMREPVAAAAAAAGPAAPLRAETPRDPAPDAALLHPVVDEDPGDEQRHRRR